MPELHWRHNDDEHRWELGYDKPVDADGLRIPGDPWGDTIYAFTWFCVSYVTDEFLAFTALTHDELIAYVAERFSVSLPAEASQRAEAMRADADSARQGGAVSAVQPSGVGRDANGGADAPESPTAGGDAR